MRAETAMATTRAGGTQRIVTVFNDVSEKLLGSGQKDIEFAPGLTGITYRRGMSIFGWATSGDGSAWTYQGKLAAPTGWAAVLGDPSIAIEAENSAVVYAAMLALNDAGWDAAYGSGTQQLSTSPKPNGFCLFRSTDGGVSFPSSKCIAMGVAGDVDLTGVAVDSGGHVFVAALDSFLLTTRVWRSGATWDALVENPKTCVVGVLPECTAATIPQFYIYDREPRLFTDPDSGSVWLVTARTTNPPELGIVSWDSAGNMDGWWDIFGTCSLLVPTMISGSFIDVLIGTTSLTKIRNAFRYSGAWGYTNITQNSAFRFAYEYNDPTGNRQTQVVEVFGDSTPGCNAPPGWNSSFSSGAAVTSRNFMTAMSYQNKGVNPAPTDMEWYMGFMYGNSPDFVDPTLQYAGFSLKGLYEEADSGAKVLMSGTRPLTPNNYYTCPLGTTGYWGDYFGVTQILAGGGPDWHALATFTDSRPAPPCTTSGTMIGMPMQIASGMEP